MSQINPFAAAILPSAQTQNQESTERVGQVRRTQDLRKNSGMAGNDTFEHQVESADAVGAIHDDDAHPDQQRKRGEKHPHSNENDAKDGDDQSHLDLTA